MSNRLRLHMDRKAAVAQDSEDILAAAFERDFTEEETAALEANETELKALSAKVEREERLLVHQASMSAVSQPADHGAAGEGSTHITVRDAAQDDPNKGFRNERDFLLSVFNAGQNGRVEDRLRPLAAAGSDEGGTYSDPYGGFLMPEGLTPSMLSMGVEEDPIGSRTTKIPMAVPTINLPARVDKDHSSSVSGGLTVTRRAETQTQSASRQQFELVSLQATSLFGLSYQTEELINDSPISIVALLQAGFSDEFSSKLIDERLNGTGVGEFLGIMNSPCLVSVSKETGQAADTIVYQNIVKMRSRCWRYGQAVWLYNQDALPTLMNLVMPVGTSGVPMWQDSAREGEPDRILGRPAIASEYCKTVGDKGDLILGVWSQYMEGTYEPLQSAESIHVRFVNHERTFKFWMRNAGAPWWKSALTPKNSTNTLSPFVALNAR